MSPATLTYWVAECLTDHSAYSCRARTRAACAELRRRTGSPQDYAKPRKVTIIYRDPFDLVVQCLGEGGVE